MSTNICFKYIANILSIISLSLALGLNPALSNDSEAEVAVGGITFLKSTNITIEAEDLFVSKNIIKVDYIYSNDTDEAIQTIIGFPLPDISVNANDLYDSHYITPNDLDFHTTVNGEQIPLRAREDALFRNQNITKLLQSNGIPLNPISKETSKVLAHLPHPVYSKLISEGIIKKSDTTESELYIGNWLLKTTMLRQQIFPPNSKVYVSHTYKPVVGGAITEYLSKHYRSEYPDDFQNMKDKFCIEEKWMKSFDKLLDDRNRKHLDNANQYWISYILRTGANWKKPIKTFRAVIDKGSPHSLVSFCADGVKKISPTKFEFTIENFIPVKDLNVLIVE